MINIEQVKAELRKEVRALKLEEKLNGYMLVHWIDGVAEDDTIATIQARLSLRDGRVLRQVFRCEWVFVLRGLTENEVFTRFL